MPSTQTLTCPACGYVSPPIESITSPTGEPLTFDDYLDLARIAGVVLLCDRCAEVVDAERRRTLPDTL